MFVDASDTHLSNLIWADRPQINGDACRAFVQIIDYAIRVREPLFLLGDLFDKKRPEPEVVQFMVSQMQRCEEAGVPVYFIQGQHELNRGDATWLGVHKWPQHVHQKSFEIAGYRFYGLDWLPRGELQPALAAVPPGTDFLLCHQVWEEFMGTHVATDGTMGDIPHARYVLTGDYHRTCIETFTGKSGPVLAVSCGSTHIQDISEDAEKAFFHCKIVSGEFVFEKIPLATRSVSRVSIMDETSLNHAVVAAATLPELHQDDRPIVQFRVLDSLPEYYSRLLTAYAGRAHLFFDQVPAAQDVNVTSQLNLPVDAPPAHVMSTVAQTIVQDNPTVLAKVQGMLAHRDKGAAELYWRENYTTHLQVQ